MGLEPDDDRLDRDHVPVDPVHAVPGGGRGRLPATGGNHQGQFTAVPANERRGHPTRKSQTPSNKHLSKDQDRVQITILLIVFLAEFQEFIPALIQENIF